MYRGGRIFFFGCTFGCILRPLRRAYVRANDCQEDSGCKKATPQVILNNKEVQPITAMYLQWTVNKTGKYLATVAFLLSPLEIIC